MSATHLEVTVDDKISNIVSSSNTEIIIKLPKLIPGDRQAPISTKI